MKLTTMRNQYEEAVSRTHARAVVAEEKRQKELFEQSQSQSLLHQAHGHEGSMHDDISLMTDTGRSRSRSEVL